MIDEVYAQTLAAMAAGRLVVFTGAGLSIPAPSNLPSATALAQQCAKHHEQHTGEKLDAAICRDIEAQARFFYARGDFESYFLHFLVPARLFAGEPNEGHLAVADFLLCRAITLSVSTNVDFLVERAAERLGEPALVAALDGFEAAIARAYATLLKLHGCMRRDSLKTLWCREQLAEIVWIQRLTVSGPWLAANLVQRDIVFVGYWTDWAYLNEAFAAYKQASNPRSVTLVDPSSEADLEAKAPALWTWARGSGATFRHVRMSGVDFLLELRRRFSDLLLKRIAGAGSNAFTVATGAPCPPFPSTMECSVDDLYDIRRDWSGVRRDHVSYRRDTNPADELLGKTFCDLIAAGGVLQGSTVSVVNQRVRLLQAAGRMMYSLKRDFAGDVPPVDAPDFTICVGAADDGAALPDIVRGNQPPSILRPAISGKWGTHMDVASLLGGA